MPFDTYQNTSPEIGCTIALRLPHIPTEVADGVSFRAHEGEDGASSCERPGITTGTLARAISVLN
jgi:hypothetical protein